MTELAKLIHAKQENDDDVIITDRHVILNHTMRLYGDTEFRNCDFELAPYNDYRFIIENDANVTFENCRFTGMLAKPKDSLGSHRPVIRSSEESTLSFNSCRFENTDSFVRSEGPLTMDGCEIIYHGEAVSGDSEYKPVYNNPYMEPFMNAVNGLGSVCGNRSDSFLMCWFISADSEDTEINSCSFECENNGDYKVKIKCEHGTVKNCTIGGIFEIEADIMDSCTCENCTTVNLQTEDGNNEASGCTFTGSNEILATDASFSNCIFSNIHESFSSNGSTVSGCTFRDLIPGNDGLFYLENTDFSDCSFENITLKNGYYLFRTDNDSSLDGCTFKKCRTTRDDLQLVSSGGFRSGFGRKWVEEDICTDCTGLDRVIHLEAWEV